MQPVTLLFGLDNPRHKVDRIWRRQLKLARRLISLTWPNRDWDFWVSWAPVHRVYMPDNTMWELEAELTEVWHTIANHVLEAINDRDRGTSPASPAQVEVHS